MKKLLTFACVFLGLSAYAQQGNFHPFKLLVLKPDTAIISKDLFSYRDSITQTQVKRYYRSVKTYEDMANCKACDFEKADMERYKKMAEELKKLEPEVKKFKYFALISSYSTEIYNFYFNENEPYSSITEEANQDTALPSLKRLAETAKADYILFFSQIHTALTDDGPILMLTSSLYSKKEAKVIFSTTTTGDLQSRGEMWTCTNPLACLLINGVRTSSNEVVAVLKKLQVKK